MVLSHFKALSPASFFFKINSKLLLTFSMPFITIPIWIFLPLQHIFSFSISPKLDFPSFHYIYFRRMEAPKQAKQSLTSSNKSPLNTSKSKAMFTFPKQERFPTVHVEGNSHFYEKENMLDKRAPSFGYGHKMDIANKSFSPSPDKYSLASEFAKAPKQGLSMGLSRDNCSSVTYFNKSNYPGVGQYTLIKDKENLKNMTISSKLKFPKLWPESIAPGPGAYGIQKIDELGECKTTKYDTVSAHKFPKSPEKTQELKTIGPGAYNTNLSSTGKQVLARNRTEKSFIFPKKDRETFYECGTSPGPGAYKHYSIFG